MLNFGERCLSVIKRNREVTRPVTTELLNVEEVADILHLHVMTVYRLVKEGKRYPEGTAVRIEPVGAKDIPTVVKLAALKLAY